MRLVLLVWVVVMAGMVAEAGAQDGVDAPVYVATYIEVMPTSAAATRSLLQRYRDATTKAPGNLRCEALQRIGEPHQFVLLETWKDRASSDAHGQSAVAVETRQKIAAMRNAPTDDRVHTALSIGRAPAVPPRALYVVTHVDVIPPLKDDGATALRHLAEASRQHAGNLRFEVGQQVNRPNHFTVMEVWADGKAFEAHSMAPATREFRDTLAPATGALYDERRYQAID